MYISFNPPEESALISQIGIWHVIDPEADKYVALAPYGYCSDNPVKFVDIHGEVIGNPNDPQVKKLQAAMMKTATGAKVWSNMEKSARTINIYFHSRKEKNIGSSLQPLTNQGVTMPQKEYVSILEGKREIPFDS